MKDSSQERGQDLCADAGSLPALAPVGWAKFSFIRDSEGREIGVDEPVVSWGPDEPPEEDDPWRPLYAAPMMSETSTQVSDKLPSEDELAQILFSVQRGAMRLRVAAVAIMNLYEAAKPTAWRYEFSVLHQEDGYRDGTVSWHVGYGAERPTYAVRNLTPLYERRK